MTLTILLVLLIAFVASLVRSTLGFGESLVAVPLLLFFLPTTTAVPLATLYSITVAIVVVIQDYSKIHFHSAKWLVLYAVLGIPLGLLILVYTDEHLIKIGLGLLIALYSLYALRKPLLEIKRKKPRMILFLCGFLSGVLGGAYSLNGPPLVIYGNIRRWHPEKFRATLQAYFLPASLLGLTGYVIKDLVDHEVRTYFAWSLLGIVPAIFLGRYLNRKINPKLFVKYTYIGLFLVGFILVINSLWQVGG